jgi:hypothetical protein
VPDFKVRARHIRLGNDHGLTENTAKCSLLSPKT